MIVSGLFQILVICFFFFDTIKLHLDLDSGTEHQMLFVLEHCASWRYQIVSSLQRVCKNRFLLKNGYNIN